MITYLTLAIAVCTLVLVIFMSFDVLGTGQSLTRRGKTSR